MKKLFILVVFALASCDRVIDFDGAVPPPKLVVNLFAGPNRAIKDRYASYSVPKFEPDTHLIDIQEAVFLFGDRKPEPIANPALRVLLNGTELPVEVETDWQTNKLYRHIHTPLTAGDRLEFEASTARHGRVTASDVVPTAARIVDLRTEWIDHSDGSGSSLRMLVTVADPAGEKNYYRFAALSTDSYRYTQIKYPYDPETGEYVPTPVTSEYDVVERKDVLTDREVLFNRTEADISDAAQWGQIADEMFDGRTYTFDLHIRLARVPYGHSYAELLSRTVTIDVETLSESTFRYLRSMEIYDSSDNLSEPVQIYTNIAGGYGIVGAYNVASRTAVITP